MICPPCKQAGRYNQRFNGPAGDHVDKRTAEYHHGRCNGRCDCQHVVGPAVVGSKVRSGVS